MALSKRKIIWSQEALNNVEEILAYIRDRWPESSVNHFKSTLFTAIEKILNFPNIGAVSSYIPRLRRLVISKQVTVFYELRNNDIYIVYIFINRKSPDHLR